MTNTIQLTEAKRLIRVTIAHKNGQIRLTNTEKSSSQFGPCEVCGADASEVYLGKALRTCQIDHDGVSYNGLTFEGGHQGCFGHKKCVLKIVTKTLDKE